MVSRRVALFLLVGAVGLAVAAVPLGRWSADRARAAERHGIESVFRKAGPIDGRRLDAYRLTSAFDCLLYRNGRIPYALEVCYDGSGRAVEAIDRTDGYRLWSLRYEPSVAPRLVSMHVLARVFRVVGADRFAHYLGSGIPLGFPDGGPTIVRQRG